MRKMTAALQLCCWVVGSLLLGFALCFLSFSYLPLMWGAGLAVAFVLYFVASVDSGRKAIPVGYVVVGFICSSLFAFSVAAFTGVERIERYECAWKVDANGIDVDLSPLAEIKEITAQAAG